MLKEYIILAKTETLEYLQLFAFIKSHKIYNIPSNSLDNLVIQIINENNTTFKLVNDPVYKNIVCYVPINCPEYFKNATL